MPSLDREYSNLANHTDDRAGEAQEVLSIVFDERGVIRECSQNCESIVGYSRDELISGHVSRLVRHLATVPLFVNGEFNPQVAFLSHCGMPFRISRRDGSTFEGAVSIVQLHHLERLTVRMLISAHAHAHEHASAPGAGL